MYRFSMIAAVLLVSVLRPAFAEVPKLRKAREYKAKMPVTVVKKIDLPKGYHEGLYYDGENIWVSNGKGGPTWMIDPSSGGIVSELETIGRFTEGITSDGKGKYWMTDWDDKMLYRVSIDSGVMKEENSISVEPAHPAGLVMVGEDLLIVTWTRGGGTKYHILELNKDGRLVQKLRIRRIHEPAHLAWDGSHLWITSWYNQLVYKVDLGTKSIIGSFRSPVPETTGIAWDGEYFWVTGTKADLYKLKVEDKS